MATISARDHSAGSDEAGAAGGGIRAGNAAVTIPASTLDDDQHVNIAASAQSTLPLSATFSNHNGEHDEDHDVDTDDDLDDDDDDMDDDDLDDDVDDDDDDDSDLDGSADHEA